MNQVFEKPKEMLYGIYFAKDIFIKGVEYTSPQARRQARRQAHMVIHEQESDESIIKGLIASDFLYTFDTFKVIDYGCSMYVVNSRGRCEVVLIYEEDYE